MNVSGFIKLVSEMRAAQIAYFKSRLPRDIVNAKDLERRVDRAIKEGIVFDMDIVVQGDGVQGTGEGVQEKLFVEDGDE